MNAFVKLLSAVAGGFAIGALATHCAHLSAENDALLDMLHEMSEEDDVFFCDGNCGECPFCEAGETDAGAGCECDGCCCSCCDCGEDSKSDSKAGGDASSDGEGEGSAAGGADSAG